jgi:hypothetical protein
MIDFHIKFEWEDSPRVRAPELAATWARLEIWCGSEAITKVEAVRTQSIRTGIYVPLYPVAEWIIANWWFLWNEWQTSGLSSRHSLLAAREGFALPDITFLPTESKVEVRWQPSFVLGSGINFLSSGAALLNKGVVKDEFRRLVDGVLERLRVRNLSTSYVFQEWQAINDAEQDPDLRAFCERAARIGLDPFDIDEVSANQIEHLGALLPEPVLDDFCDVVPLQQIASGAESVSNFVDSAKKARPAPGKWQEIRMALKPSSSDIPWLQGYHDARALRSYLDVEGPITEDLRDYLGRTLGSLEIADFDAPDRIDAISLPTVTTAPIFGLRDRLRDVQARFSLCRALGDHIAFGTASLVTRSRNEHQQRNRAFAAEFLAPAQSIRDLISGDMLGDEDVEELARTFQVSDFVIRHQVQNHNLARLRT